LTTKSEICSSLFFEFFALAQAALRQRIHRHVVELTVTAKERVARRLCLKGVGKAHSPPKAALPFLLHELLQGRAVNTKRFLWSAELRQWLTWMRSSFGDTSSMRWGAEVAKSSFMGVGDMLVYEEWAEGWIDEGLEW
jgi:hypothetical protein